MGMSRKRDAPHEAPKRAQVRGDAQTAKPILKDGKEVRGIVRLAGRDLLGGVPLKRAINRVKGVGLRLAGVLSQVIFKEMKLPPDTLIGELEEAQLEQLEKIMSSPFKHGVPSWMINRQKDIETGEDKHLVGTDLTFTIKQDIEREKNMNTWIGYRHNYGQKVRGQRTRTTGRSGMTVGVIRKTILAKAAAAKTAAPAATGAPAAKKEEKK